MVEFKKEKEKRERDTSISCIAQFVCLAFPVGNHVGRGVKPLPTGSSTGETGFMT
jgi:hypothetical protein